MEIGEIRMMASVKKMKMCDPCDSNSTGPSEINIISGNMSFSFKFRYVSGVTFTEPFIEWSAYLLWLYAIFRR